MLLGLGNKFMAWQPRCRVNSGGGVVVVANSPEDGGGRADTLAGGGFPGLGVSGSLETRKKVWVKRCAGDGGSSQYGY